VQCGVHHVVGVLGVSGPPLEVVAGRAGCVVVGFVDAAELADRFGLGRARKLSDGPVARGRQGEVWRLETADGRWAVKVPFDESGEAELLASTEFHEAACAAGVPAVRSRSPAPAVSMLIAQLGHIAQVEAWIGETHTRRVLNVLLRAVS
jgi:hypothetical protein